MYGSYYSGDHFVRLVRNDKSSQNTYVLSKIDKDNLNRL